MKQTLTTAHQPSWTSIAAWAVGLGMVCVLSAMAWYYFHLQGLTITYNDSMSHLNLSRFVIDNVKPGLAQLGGVWLPIPHLFPMLLIWHEWSWHSGFAASIFSMAAYVVSVVGVFIAVRVLTKDTIAGIVGALVFALNLNMIYLQATPLTEPLYVCFFVMSVVAYVMYVDRDDAKYLFVMGLFGFLQVLTRYDGWFVVGVEGLLVLAYELGVKRRGLMEAISKAAVFGFPVAFGVGLWLLWNLLIFNDLFFFALGPYSAHSQQTNLEEKSGLITKHSWFYATLSYLLTSVHNVGAVMVVTGFFGSLYYLLKGGLKRIGLKTLVLLFVCTPIIFNVLALYLGFSVISIPEITNGSSNELSKQWFNVRYGILALPFAAIFTGVLASWGNLLKIGLVVLIAAQVYLMSRTGLITILDGTVGSSSFDNYDIGKFIEQHVGPDDQILLSTSFFNSVAFVSHKPLKQFIHEGASELWQATLIDPYEHADWIVMSNGDVGETVFSTLLKHNPQKFLAFYKVAFVGKHAYVFKRRAPHELFVRREGDELLVGKEAFEVRGVNAYDLAFRSEAEIEQSFAELNEAGVNTIRFWLFNNGSPDGFQPTAGGFNEAAFRKSDLILSLANQYNMKLIPVLVNNWEEYGGREQYLAWIGKDPAVTDVFYTDPAAKELYKNYLNVVMSRHNHITGTQYAEDPAILAWDLVNEPRAADPRLAQSWLQEMAVYVRQHDQIHLVMTGTERLVSDTNEQHAIGVCELEPIDICSVHLYVYDEDRLLFENAEAVMQFLRVQADVAEQQNKPIMLGEWGVSKETQPFDQAPLTVLQQVASTARQQGYNGSLIWNWSVMPDESFGFSPVGDEQQRFSRSDLREVVAY